jgi:hypothetical protein
VPEPRTELAQTLAGLPISRLSKQAEHSEMRIGMRTTEFGSIEVHTVLRDNRLGVSIASERGDLRSCLSPDVPALQSRLGQQDVHLEEVKFLLPPGDPGSGGSQAGPRQQSWYERHAMQSASVPAGEESPGEDSSFPVIAQNAYLPEAFSGFSILV